MPSSEKGVALIGDLTTWPRVALKKTAHIDGCTYPYYTLVLPFFIWVSLTEFRNMYVC